LLFLCIGCCLLLVIRDEDSSIETRRAPENLHQVEIDSGFCG
jgi:hypothetical protein